MNKACKIKVFDTEDLLFERVAYPVCICSSPRVEYRAKCETNVQKRIQQATIFLSTIRNPFFGLPPIVWRGMS